MNIVTRGERTSYIPDNAVRGVELDGLDEALELVGRLGTKAQIDMEPVYGLENAEGLRSLTAHYGAEALTLQAQLLAEIRRGSIVVNAPFTFVAVDGQAGRVLRSATEVTDEQQSQAAKRPFLRFPETIGLLGRNLLGLFDQPKTIKSFRRSSSNDNDFGTGNEPLITTDRITSKEYKPLNFVDKTDKY